MAKKKKFIPIAESSSQFATSSYSQADENPRPKQAPKQAPKQVPKQAPTQAPKQAPTQVPKQAPKQAPKQVPKQAPVQAAEAPTPAWVSSPPAHVQAAVKMKSLAERALPQKTVEDRIGLTRAYDAPQSIYIRGNVAYTAGTQASRWKTGEAFRDAYDDAKIPLGLTWDTWRYGQLQKALAAHPEVDTLVGHSLGGATVLQMAQDNPKYKTTTYGAPVMNVFARTSLEAVPNRFASRGDPIAMMDTNAQTDIVLGNPHGFNNFHHTSATTSAPGYENPDKTVTLFE
jgi:hypothetical protein